MPIDDQPLVAVVIPALNEAGKIGRVLDKMPRDGRFEAIVVDDGSTDGTGDEARAHGAAVVVRHEVRGGVGAAIRDGCEGRRRTRSTLRWRSSPATTSTSLASWPGALERLLAARRTTCRDRAGCRAAACVGPAGGRGLGTRLYSLRRSASLTFRRISDATNGFRVFRLADPRRPAASSSTRPGSTATTSSRTCSTRRFARLPRGARHPCTVRYHANEGYTKMRGLRDWWRLFRPALLLRLGVKR